MLNCGLCLQRPAVFAAEVYDSLVESPAWDKHKPAHLHATHLAVPRSHDKKEPTQLSPVKKRVKEGTPPTGTCRSLSSNLVILLKFIIFF